MLTSLYLKYHRSFIDHAIRTDMQSTSVASEGRRYELLTPRQLLSFLSINISERQGNGRDDIPGKSSIQAATKYQEPRRDELLLVMTRTRLTSSQYLNPGESVKEMK
jgi:hypothetical protein